MKKLYLSPAVPVVLGLGLGIFRGFEQRLAYEPETGLLIPGHPMMWLFWLLIAALAVLELCLHRPWQKEAPQFGGLRLAAEGDLPALGLTLAGLLVLAFGVRNVTVFLGIDPVDTAWRLFLAPVTAASFLGGAALVVLAAAAKRKDHLDKLQIAVLLPVVWAGLWAVYYLWDCSADPVTDSYLPELLGRLLLGLSFARLAGFAFQDARPRRTRLLTRLAVLLCTTSLVGAAVSALLSGGGQGALEAVVSRLGLLGGIAGLVSCDWAIGHTPRQPDVPEPPKEDKKKKPQPEGQSAREDRP